MDFFKILKNAYIMVFKHRFLWLFGILAGGYGGAKITNYPSTNSRFMEHFSNQSWSTVLNSDASTVIGVLGLFILVIAIALIFLNIVSQGALIGSVNKLASGHDSNFADGFMIGWHNFWKVVGLGASAFVIALGIGVIWLIPTAVFALYGVPALAIVWGILFLIIFILYLILVSIIMPYAMRLAIIKKFGLFKSIREGLHLVRDNFLNVILMYIILFAISIAFGVVLVSALVIAGMILFGIGYILFLITPILAAIYSVIVVVALLITILAIAGAYGTFSSSVLTYTFRELTK